MYIESDKWTLAPQRGCIYSARKLAVSNRLLTERESAGLMCVLCR